MINELLRAPIVLACSQLPSDFICKSYREVQLCATYHQSHLLPLIRN